MRTVFVGLNSLLLLTGAGLWLIPAPDAVAKTRNPIVAYVPPVRINGKAYPKVRSRIRWRLRGLASCLVPPPGPFLLSRPAKVTFDLLPTGWIRRVRVVTSYSATLTRCIVKRVRRWRLPRVPRRTRVGPVVVRWRRPSAGSDRLRPDPNATVYRVPIPGRHFHNPADRKLRSKMRSRTYSLYMCYNRALLTRPKLRGTVTISFLILPNGRVTRARVKAKGLPETMRRCILGKVKRWHLGRRPNKLFYGPFRLAFRPPKHSTAGSVARRPPVVRRRPRVKSRVIAKIPRLTRAGKSAQLLRRKIRARIYGLRVCHNRALAKNPKVQGRIKFVLIIIKTGRVMSVYIQDSNLPKQMRTCLKNRMKRWFLIPLPHRLAVESIQLTFRTRR